MIDAFFPCFLTFSSGFLVFLAVSEIAKTRPLSCFLKKSCISEYLLNEAKYGRRPSPVYQHYPSHHRNIHGSHLDRRLESPGVGEVAETYKVRSEKCRKFFLGIEKKAGQMQKVGAFT